MRLNMNILLVIDPDTRNQREHKFDADLAVEEIRWEAFSSMPERLFAQQDAYVGDSIFPALFLNTLTVTPGITSVLPDGRVYVSVTTKDITIPGKMGLLVCGCVDICAGHNDAAPINGYDYRNQAWVVDGRYVACSHPASMKCNCYGTVHAGELLAANADVH